MPLKTVFSLLFCFFIGNAYASDAFFGKLHLQQVSDNAYAIVGPMSNRDSINSGNNATFGFVVTSKGVVLIDSGGTLQGAKNIHSVIKSVTQLPIVYVINTGGQDHRWLGNDYFKKLGAKIIASAEAVKDQKSRLKEELFMLNNLVGVEGVNGTKAVYADTVFDKHMTLKVGDTTLELYHTAKAHTAGDSFVVLAKEHIVFAGDIIFTQRLLGVADHSSSKGWIESFNALAAFKPKYIVPGHGDVTTLKIAKQDTLDYLIFLRQAVLKFMQADGDMADISQVDQSSFAHLISFGILSGRNAQTVYTELEWE